MTKTIRETTSHELIINKSRFIGLLIPLSDVKEVPLYLEEARDLYPDANHYCYAYIINAYQKASDDGEPAKTAGIPMLTVLQKNELDHVLAIVIRYFGGIKLGAGGLVRAYSQSVAQAIQTATIVTKVKAMRYALQFAYHYTRQMDYFLKSHNIELLTKDYQEEVIYQCFILDEHIIEVMQEKFANQIKVTELGFDDVEIKEEDENA